MQFFATAVPAVTSAAAIERCAASARSGKYIAELFVSVAYYAMYASTRFSGRISLHFMQRKW